ncbi:erythromycin esterase family protein [Streptomyces sp. NBC_01236]|uniref:erythromycin esterase family protein n=1 Tax=Streptomyces sp. NBC_01236 TaxID=2903789 RepID=UPI002E0F26B9
MRPAGESELGKAGWGKTTGPPARFSPPPYGGLPDGPPEPRTGPSDHETAPARIRESTLDQARYRDYVVDLREVGSPAREWLDRTRPTRFVGTNCPGPDFRIALGRSHDILIHVHRVEGARLRDR